MSIASDYTNGMGGLRFVAQSPAGPGRLIRLPFYIESAVDGFEAIAPGASGAPAASGTASTTSPVIAAWAASAIGTGNTATLKTPQISWATLRIVGFEVAINEGSQNTQAKTELVFSDLQIGGGANLFVHEDFAPANIYLSGQDSFAGLRDYPLLKSPNVAQVSVAMFTPVAAGAVPPAAATIADWQKSKIFSCNLVCEILQDDNYGAHIPGPYARR
jgi:hypothetical protein